MKEPRIIPARFTSRACILYICITPLLLWPTTGWLTPLIAPIVAFILLGIENVTVQIEEVRSGIGKDRDSINTQFP